MKSIFFTTETRRKSEKTRFFRKSLVATNTMFFTTGFTGLHRVNLNPGKATVTMEATFFTTRKVRTLRNARPGRATIPYAVIPGRAVSRYLRI